MTQEFYQPQRYQTLFYCPLVCYKMLIGRNSCQNSFTGNRTAVRSKNQKNLFLQLLEIIQRTFNNCRKLTVIDSHIAFFINEFTAKTNQIGCVFLIE